MEDLGINPRLLIKKQRRKYGRYIRRTKKMPFNIQIHKQGKEGRFIARVYLGFFETHEDAQKNAKLIQDILVNSGVIDQLRPGDRRELRS